MLALFVWAVQTLFVLLYGSLLQQKLEEDLAALWPVEKFQLWISSQRSNPGEKQKSE